MDKVTMNFVRACYYLIDRGIVASELRLSQRLGITFGQWQKYTQLEDYVNTPLLTRAINDFNLSSVYLHTGRGPFLEQ
jgi:hypothetical protein